MVGLAHAAARRGHGPKWLDWPWVNDHYERDRHRVRRARLRSSAGRVLWGLVLALPLGVARARAGAGCTWPDDRGDRRAVHHPVARGVRVLLPVHRPVARARRSSRWSLYTLLILVRNVLVGLDARAGRRARGGGGNGLLADAPPVRGRAAARGAHDHGRVRIATVTTIGLVTVAAIVGQGGLGPAHVHSTASRPRLPTPLTVGDAARGRVRGRGRRLAARRAAARHAVAPPAGGLSGAVVPRCRSGTGSQRRPLVGRRGDPAPRCPAPPDVRRRRCSSRCWSRCPSACCSVTCDAAAPSR